MLLALAGLIIVADTLVATQAFAAPAGRGTPPATLGAAAIAPPTTAAPVTTTTKPAPRPAAPKPKAVVKPRPQPKAAPALRPRPQPQPARTVAAAPSAPAGARAGIVAAIIWPSGWRPICAGPRDGLLGLTSPQGTTTLYVRSSESLSLLRIVAIHESGHAWNFARLDAKKIGEWCKSRGCNGGAFFAGGASGAGWREPGGAEDWAAAWDACHGGSYHRSYIGLPAPTGAQCALQNRLTGYPG